MSFKDIQERFKNYEKILSYSDVYKLTSDTNKILLLMDLPENEKKKLLEKVNYTLELTKYLLEENQKLYNEEQHEAIKQIIEMQKDKTQRLEFIKDLL